MGGVINGNANSYIKFYATFGVGVVYPELTIYEISANLMGYPAVEHILLFAGMFVLK